MEVAVGTGVEVCEAVNVGMDVKVSVGSWLVDVSTGSVERGTDVCPALLKLHPRIVRIKIMERKYLKFFFMRRLY